MSRPDPSDFGTPEIARRREIQIEETIRAGVFRARVDSGWLERYHRQGWLDDTQETATAMWDAGNRLTGDFTVWGVLPSVVSGCYDALVAVSGGIQEVNGHREDARRRVNAALAGMNNDDQRIVLIRVCLYDEPAGRGKGMKLLRAGLHRLVGHYGY